MWGNPCSGGVNTTPLTLTGSGVKPPPREGHTHRGQCHTLPSPGEVSVPVTPLLSPVFSFTGWGALPNGRIIFLFLPATFVTATQSLPSFQSSVLGRIVTFLLQEPAAAELELCGNCWNFELPP